MNRTHWQWGYRSALMDVFYGRPMVDAANRPEDLSADFVSGALAARERCDELTEMCDTDPLEYARAMGGTTWECADAAASMEAMAAWDRLVAAKDESRQIAEEIRFDEMREEMLERRWHANDEDRDNEALAVELNERVR